MADFSSLLTILVFDLQKLAAPQIKSHTLVNLVDTTLFEKYVDP